MERAGGKKMSARSLLTGLLAAFVLAAPARAQQKEDDDNDDPFGAQPVVVQGGFTDENFDQWVFQNNGNFAGARQQLNLLLALQVEDIDRACKLTDAQKKKLQLTGRCDIKRFFDLYEKVKQKFQLVKNDQQKMQEIWQAMSPLQIMLQSGLFHEDAFLFKSLHNTLTGEQFERYQALTRERLAFRHRADIELAVMMLELNMPLRAAQRRELITLLSNVTKPPRKSGQYAYYVLMYQLAQLPEGKLKPLFDDAQWNVVSGQFNQYKGMRQWLKQSGQLPEEDDDQTVQKR
jgi:hypothetical protein